MSFDSVNPSSGHPSAPLYAIVAMGRNNEIGFRGDMPWHISEDLRHFKTLTTGHPVIMGRATWLSLPLRPLPGRTNIVVSRNPHFVAEGALTAPSLPDAIALCEGLPVPFIIGGGTVYAASMPLLSRAYVTRIEADFPDADTFFPNLDPSQWELIEHSPLRVSEPSGLSYYFETYERRHNQ